MYKKHTLTLTKERVERRLTEALTECKQSSDIEPTFRKTIYDIWGGCCQWEGCKTALKYTTHSGGTKLPNLQFHHDKYKGSAASMFGVSARPPTLLDNLRLKAWVKEWAKINDPSFTKLLCSTHHLNHAHTPGKKTRKKSKTLDKKTKVH